MYKLLSPAKQSLFPAPLPGCCRFQTHLEWAGPDADDPPNPTVKNLLLEYVLAKCLCYADINLLKPSGNFTYHQV
jgi:hypothetical protein